jgi:hypothetical protein
MIHDIDQEDLIPSNLWEAANPLLGQGLAVDAIEKEFVKAQINLPNPKFQD